MTRLGNARTRAGVFVFAVCCALELSLSGCALIIPQTEEMRQHRPEGLASPVEITEVPFFPQKELQCGPAALATSLAYFGAPVTADDLESQVYLPERHGSLQIEMIAAARHNGMVAYKLKPRYEDVLREIDAGFPVIILLDYGVWPVRLWHYAVAVGYDMNEGHMVLRSGEKRRLIVPFSVLEYLWSESDYWALVTSPPARIPVTATEAAYLKAVVELEQTGSKTAARTAYGAMLERWPDSLGAGIGLANVDYALGDLHDAETVLRRMVDQHPDAAVAYNNLAQTLLDEGRGTEALPLAEKAVELGGPYLANSRETLQTIASRVKGGGVEEKQSQ
jgi:tetratricopeptide (TPR) repeat protein